MPGPYTLKRLAEIEDSAPKFGLDAVQEARFATPALQAEHTGVSHHRVKPGCRQAMGHAHEEAEEVYVVLSGSGRIKVDDEVVQLVSGDAIRVAPPVMRSFEADADGLEFIAFGPRHEGDGSVVPGWWSD